MSCSNENKSDAPPLNILWRAKGQKSFFSVDIRHFSIEAARVFVVWFFVAIPAGYAMGSNTDTTLSDAGDIIGDGKIVVLEPEKWIGKRFPLFDYINIGEQLKEGQWLMLLYHYDCPKCKEMIIYLSDTVKEERFLHVALVELPPYAIKTQYYFLQGWTCVFGRIKNDREWFAETPALKN